MLCVLVEEEFSFVCDAAAGSTHILNNGRRTDTHFLGYIYIHLKHIYKYRNISVNLIQMQEPCSRRHEFIPGCPKMLAHVHVFLV